MLLDAYLPAFDLRTRYATRIAASPEVVYATLRTANFDQWGLTRTLDALRTLPALPTAPRATWQRFRAELRRPRATLADLLASGFSLLAERPGEELVLGTVGRFWRAHGELHAPSAAQFLAPAPPGTAKAAWNFAVARQSSGGSVLRTETRVVCADAATRWRLRAYWLLISLASGLIACVRSAQSMPSSTVRRSWRGRPTGGRCGGSSGRTASHSAAVSSPTLLAGVSPAGGGGTTAALARGRSRSRARRAPWQRAATACCVRRQNDQPR